MKKVLIGAGIGCGALILIGVVVLGAGAFWAKDKLQGVAESAQKMQKQSKDLNALNAKYPFSAPKEGEPLRLQKDRLEKYFTIRDALLPVYQRFEAKGKELEAKTKSQNGQASLGDSMKAAGMVANLTTELRAAYINGLQQQGMSPSEFQYTTQAIFSAEPGTHTNDLNHAEQQSLEMTVKSLEQSLKNPGLSAEQKGEIQKQLDGARESLAEVNKNAAGSVQVTQVHTENAKLLAPYKDRIEKEINPGLDALLISGAEGGSDHEQQSE